MPDRQFKLRMYEVALTADGRITVGVGKRVLSEAPLAEVATVHVTANTLFDTVSCAITYRGGGKEKKLTPLSAKGGNPDLQAFLDALREALPESARVDDEVTPDLSDLSTERVYALGGSTGFMPQPRWAVLFMWWVLGACTCIALPVAIYLTPRYRLRSDGQGVEIRRFGTENEPWSDVTGYRLTRIQRRQNGMSMNALYQFELLCGGSTPKFVMGGVDGGRFLAELKARGLQAA